MKFNENRSKGSGDMERTGKSYGRNVRLTDRQTKGIPIIPLPLCGGGLTIKGLISHMWLIL